jgi:hypothetical protein
MGLLARRTIAEGKNRQAGLTQIIGRNACIHSARTNIVWPGKASVIVHQINIVKGIWNAPCSLNGETADFISANLGDTEFTSAANYTGQCRFQGSILLGEGFKLEETEVRKLLDLDSKYKSILYPFVGGNEVNQTAHATPSCLVINF